MSQGRDLLRYVSYSIENRRPEDSKTRKKSITNKEGTSVKGTAVKWLKVLTATLIEANVLRQKLRKMLRHFDLG